jgi:hypothetical protein
MNAKCTAALFSYNYLLAVNSQEVQLERQVCSIYLHLSRRGSFSFASEIALAHQDKTHTEKKDENGTRDFYVENGDGKIARLHN